MTPSRSPRLTQLSDAVVINVIALAQVDRGRRSFVLVGEERDLIANREVKVRIDDSTDKIR